MTMELLELVEDNGRHRMIFRYPYNWKACRYDEENDPANAFYKSKIKRASGISAVDFIATDHERSQLIMVECKDFRSATPENMPRLSEQPPMDEKTASQLLKNNKLNVKVTRKKPYLPDEFAKNIRDTLFGILAAQRYGDVILSPFSELFMEGKPLSCVLALQLDIPDSWLPNESVRIVSRLKQVIEQKLSFIKAVDVIIDSNLAEKANKPWEITG